MSRLDRSTWATAPTYPTVPGHVHGSRTSREAANRIRPKSESLETFVLSVLTVAGREGLTDAEINAAARREGIQSEMRPRRATLFARGDIREAGFTRPSPTSGLKMTVWVLHK